MLLAIITFFLSKHGKRNRGTISDPHERFSDYDKSYSLLSFLSKCICCHLIIYLMQRFLDPIIVIFSLLRIIRALICANSITSIFLRGNFKSFILIFLFLMRMSMNNFKNQLKFGKTKI